MDNIVWLRLVTLSLLIDELRVALFVTLKCNLELQILLCFEYDLGSRYFVHFGSIAYDTLSLLHASFVQKPSWRFRNQPAEKKRM